MLSPFRFLPPPAYYAYYAFHIIDADCLPSPFSFPIATMIAALTTAAARSPAATRHFVTHDFRLLIYDCFRC